MASGRISACYTKILFWGFYVLSIIAETIMPTCATLSCQKQQNTDHKSTQLFSINTLSVKLFIVRFELKR